MPSGNPLYDQLKAIVVIRDDPAFAGYDAVRKALHVGHQLSGALLFLYEDLRGDATKQAELTEALQMFYAEYIEPIDLPVNDFVEQFIDTNLAGFIAPLVKAIDAKLDEKLPHGPDAE